MSTLAAYTAQKQRVNHQTCKIATSHFWSGLNKEVSFSTVMMRKNIDEDQHPISFPFLLSQQQKTLCIQYFS